MIINLKDITRIKEFLNSNDTEMCERCKKWDNEDVDIVRSQCKDDDICERYTPNHVHFSKGTEDLFNDLFETIKHLYVKG